MRVCPCVCVGLCASRTLVLPKPEEGVRSPRAGVTDGMSSTFCVQGTKLGSCGAAARVPDSEPPAQPQVLHFKEHRELAVFLRLPGP